MIAEISEYSMESDSIEFGVIYEQEDEQTADAVIVEYLAARGARIRLVRRRQVVVVMVGWVLTQCPPVPRLIQACCSTLRQTLNRISLASLS